MTFSLIFIVLLFTFISFSFSLLQVFLSIEFCTILLVIFYSLAYVFSSNLNYIDFIISIFIVSFIEVLFFIIIFYNNHKFYSSFSFVY